MVWQDIPYCRGSLVRVDGCVCACVCACSSLLYERMSPTHALLLLLLLLLGVTEPYITRTLLYKTFGADLAAEAAARYFIEGEGPGGFRLRPEYTSERVCVCV